jgi:formate dehydrogenase major subunit
LEDFIFSVEFDGKEYKAKKGQTILEAARDQKIYIPTLCRHPNLRPLQTCDTCYVGVEGELVRSCANEVVPGMKIDTQSPLVKNAQNEAMDRVLVNHELYCTVCDNNNGNCEIHNTVMAMGVEHQQYPFTPKPYPPDNSHPFYRYEPDQCILCGRCVEACQDLQVNETLRIDWNREVPRVIWDHDVPIDQSSCVSCGHCVNACPCNALMEKSMLGEAGYLTAIPPKILGPMIDLTKEVETGYQDIMAISEVEAALRKQRIKRTKTVCTYCGVGCSFEVWTKDRQILKIQTHKEAPVNGISTCVKGKWGWDFINSEDRLTKPMIRKGKEFVEASWEEALALIAANLHSIKNKYGPHSIGYVASSKCSNEENYIFQKFARSVMGTNNVDNCSRYCQTPASTGLMRTVGIGGDSGTVQDLIDSELVIIIGANPAESHPVIATRVKRAHKLHGQKLIVADIRKHEMAERADLYIHPKPSTDLIWLSAVTKYILDQGWEDKEFLKNRVNGLEEYIASLDKYTLEYASETTGLKKEELIKFATMIHEAKSACICWAMGITQHKGGSNASTAISNLLLITGNYGRPGTGAYPLRGHNNVQGACDFGTMPPWMPGYESIHDSEVRSRYEHAWGVNLSDEPGLNNHQMVEAMDKGKLKALYLFGEDMSFVDSNSNHVESGFEKLEFFVVQDIFFSRTAQFADVILPAAPSLEKEGTFVNTERRIQRFYQVFEPLGNSRPDWKIIQELANRLGAEWNYQHPSEIMAECASLATMFAGVNYDLLEGWESQLWPVLKDGTSTPLLYKDRFALPDGKAKLFIADWIEPVDSGEEFDLHLNNGRILEHFHEGNMTYRSAGLIHKVAHPWVEVSLELAKERNVKDGSLVKLTSPYGMVKVRVIVTDRVKGNELYLTMNTREVMEAVNRLTSSYHDIPTHTPAFKEASVKMEVLEINGESPLPKHNHRFGNRVPQLGVKVEDKWERNDFTPIPDLIEKRRDDYGEGHYRN